MSDTVYKINMSSISERKVTKNRIKELRIVENNEHILKKPKQIL